jgi:hypothetical protein
LSLFFVVHENIPESGGGSKKRAGQLRSHNPLNGNNYYKAGARCRTPASIFGGRA